MYIFGYDITSPSRFIVSTKTIPEGLSDLRRIISDGNSSSFKTLISSPALISYHFFCLNWPDDWSKIKASLLFNSLSCLCLATSSHASLSIVKIRTATKVPNIDPGDYIVDIAWILIL